VPKKTKADPPLARLVPDPNATTLDLKKSKALSTLPSLAGWSSVTWLSLRGFDVIPDGLDLPPSLTSLLLEKCRPASLACLQRAQHLAELRFVDCDLEVVPSGLRSLPSLRHVGLFREAGYRGDPRDLSMGGDLFEHDRLEELEISGFRVASLPAGLGRCRALKTLVVIEGVRELPETIGALHQLRELNLRSHQLESIPESLGDLVALEDLTLASRECDVARWSLAPVCRLRSLRSLDLTGLPLPQLPDEIGALTRLESLDVTLTKLKRLPDGIDRLTALRSLSLAGVHFADRVHELARLRSLTSLQELSLEWWTAVPDTIGELQQLKVVRVPPQFGDQVSRLLPKAKVKC